MVRCILKLRGYQRSTPGHWFSIRDLTAQTRSGRANISHASSHRQFYVTNPALPTCLVGDVCISTHSKWGRSCRWHDFLSSRIQYTHNRLLLVVLLESFALFDLHVLCCTKQKDTVSWSSAFARTLPLAFPGLPNSHPISTKEEYEY